ncbi:glycosyltransferase family 4 protein [Spirosoma aerophilum]
MTIIYLFRSPGTGHSIEQLFHTIRSEIDQQDEPVKVVLMPRISRGLYTVWQNMRFTRRLTADLIHITGDVHYAALALPASRTILTIHDCFLLENNRRRPLRYATFWLFWYYLPMRRAGVVTAISEKTRQDLIRHVGRLATRVQVVPNGYDPLFSYSPRPFNRDQPTLLQIGTADHKNLFRLLAAIEGISCTLVIVGSLTNKLITELHQRQIRFRQYSDLTKAALVQLYVDCDIVTFVSTCEGFGMPILEANAVGRVVITSDRSPMRDVAAGAAHLVDPEDITAIRAGILRLTKHDLYRQSLIESGLKNAQRFTAASVADQYRSVYRQCRSIHHSAPVVS